MPTAQQLPEEVQRMPSSSLEAVLAVPPGWGVGTSDHRRPFQCSARLNPGPESHYVLSALFPRPPGSSAPGRPAATIGRAAPPAQ